MKSVEKAESQAYREAKVCLPIGPHPVYGLRFPTRVNDYLYFVWEHHVQKSCKGKDKSRARKTTVAVTNKHFPPLQGAQLLKGTINSTAVGINGTENAMIEHIKKALEELCKDGI